MADTRYTSDHEWVRLEDDGTLTIGITDYAQDALGDIVFAELPEIDREVAEGESSPPSRAPRRRATFMRRPPAASQKSTS